MGLNILILQVISIPRFPSGGVTRIHTEGGATEVSLWVKTLEVTGEKNRRGISS